MDRQARHELSRSIQKEGVGLSDDPQRIKALLLDACPESRTEISLLVAAAEDEIPSRLARSSESVFRDGEIARAVADLKRTRRLDPGAADWVVRSWAWALGVVDQEPSDDPGDTLSEIPVEARVSGAQSGPPQYQTTAPHQASMSAPPYFAQPNPGYTAPSQPAASSSPEWAPTFGPTSGHPSQPWPPGSASSGRPGGQGADPPPWGPQPGNQGWVTDGWAGVPPPTPGWPPAPPSPPGRGRGRLVAILAAAAVVILLAVLGVVLLNAASPASTSDANRGGTQNPVPTGDPTPSDVNFTISNSLGSFEVADTVTVYSFGKEVGTLQIDSASPTARLPVSGPPGPIDYQLTITMFLTDGGSPITLNGSGTITAYAGAEYSVQIEQNSAGNYVATLQAESGTST